jgi:Flp pilus assembly protein TadB
VGTLTVAVVAMVALWRGLHWPQAVVAGAVMLHPGAGLAAVGGLALLTRMAAAAAMTPDDEAALLRDLAAELDGGASVRAALMRVFHGLDDRLSGAIRFGYPNPVVAAELERLLPLNGRRAATAISIGASSGAALRAAVGLLATRAADRGRLLRDRRAATAQARATAWLLSVFPVAVVAFTVLSGRLTESTTLPVVAAGLALQGAGIGIVVAMLRRGA